MTHPTTIPLTSDSYLWFDLDDTLWDMTGNSDLTLRRLFAEDPDVSRAYASKGVQAWLDTYHAVNRELWEGFAAGTVERSFLRLQRFMRPLTMAGMPAAEAEAAARRLDTLYLELLGRCPATVPGAREAVGALARRGVRMGIVSNGFAEVQHNKLHSGGLDGLFCPVVLSDDCPEAKPHRAFFDCAAARAGADPGACIVVGDNPLTDIAGALRAGWRAAVWYNPAGESAPEYLLPYADRIVTVRKMSELTRILA